ncbi:hypothetical protein LLH00_06015 [bacterium]|nr:hypothetical protein [bacterium]
MSYNSLESAKTLLGGIEVSQENLNAARSMIDNHSEFRWEETVRTDRLSGDGESDSFFIRFPVIEITSLMIDGVAQTEGEDFQVSKDIGRVMVFNGLPKGQDNIECAYKYGYDSEHEACGLIRMVEATIALYLARNPMMVKTVNFGGQGGVDIEYGTGIPFYLSLIPTPRGI